MVALGSPEVAGSTPDGSERRPWRSKTTSVAYPLPNFVGQWPGSTHDARIDLLDESNLAREFEEGIHKGILLGDSGYPCRA